MLSTKAMNDIQFWRLRLHITFKVFYKFNYILQMGSCRMGTQITAEIREIRRESGHFKDILSKIDTGPAEPMGQVGQLPYQFL